MVKKGEVVKFGAVMSRKEHELLESRCAVLKAIAQGLELAKKGDVEPEDREFFEKMEKGGEHAEGVGKSGTEGGGKEGRGRR